MVVAVIVLMVVHSLVRQDRICFVGVIIVVMMIVVVLVVMMLVIAFRVIVRVIAFGAMLVGVVVPFVVAVGMVGSLAHRPPQRVMRTATNARRAMPPQRTGS